MNATMNATAQRNIDHMLGIQRILDNADMTLNQLKLSQQALRNKVAMAVMRRGAHTTPQLIALRQALARQATALMEAAGELDRAAMAAHALEAN